MTERRSTSDGGIDLMPRVLAIRVLAIAVAAVLALPVAGCGGSGDTGGDDAKAARSISKRLLEQQKAATGTSQLLSFDRKDADCIGRGLVRRIGTERLQRYGLLTKDLNAKGSVDDVSMSHKDASSATDTLFSCTDAEAMVRTAVERTGNVPRRMRACVRRALTEDVLRPLFTKAFEGDADAARKALTTPLMRCAVDAGGG